MLQQHHDGSMTMLVRDENGTYRDVPVQQKFEPLDYRLDSSSRGHAWRTTEQGIPKITERCGNPNCGACKRYA